MAENLDSKSTEITYLPRALCSSNAEAAIERAKTSIVHSEERIVIDIDLSSVNLPQLLKIQCIRTTSADELDYERFAITRPQKSLRHRRAG